ncbi:MAG TPA: ABC-F family ATP-binding cassette domain-containing protein [Fibrobacteria bacterium]|nr:ABC-F family ATP-binding cassette domain-containing protein [Fibrobacteria bacterium]
MIEAQSINLAYGPRVLLDNVSFQLSDRGRLCLAGVNGSGKSTLFTILMGEQQPDSGKIVRSGGLKMGLLRQHAEFPEEATAFTGALEAFSDVMEKAARLDVLHHAMGERELTEAEMRDLDILQDAVVHGGYYTAEAETRAVLHGLGFGRDQQDKRLADLSGGWKMRVALAKLLLQKPDCLLLDEPTNHLDLESILWLEGYLRAYPGSILLVCHDRRFVDNVCEGVLDLRMGKLDLYSLPFEKYEEERAMRVALQQKSAAKAQDEIDRLNKFIDRFKAKASKATLAKSAIKKRDRIEVVEVEREGPSMRLRFPAIEYAGATAWKAENIGKRYGEKRVFSGGEFTILPGDKVALVGPNGAGKTTLMRLLAEEAKPEEGELKRGSALRSGYYAQYVEPTEAEKKTPILEILREAFPLAGDGAARAALGAMMFSGDDAKKYFGVLSGGERARVRLARLLLAPGNALLLDEPTNHLDVRSKDLLLDALADYPGTVVFVSHDRDFAEQLATRVIRVDGGTITEYPGDFAYYTHKVEDDLKQEARREAEAERSAAKKGGSAKAQQAAPQQPVDPRDAAKASEKDRRRREKREAEVMARIEALEARGVAIDAELCLPDVFSDPAALRKLSQEKAAGVSELETLYAELATVGQEAA